MKTQSSLRTIQILEKCFEFKMMLDYLVPGLFSTSGPKIYPATGALPIPAPNLGEGIPLPEFPILVWG